MQRSILSRDWGIMGIDCLGHEGVVEREICFDINIIV